MPSILVAFSFLQIIIKLSHLMCDGWCHPGDWKSSNYTSFSWCVSHMITKTRIEPWSNNENFSLSPPRLTFLAWGDFNARSRFARSSYPWGKMGTTRTLWNYWRDIKVETAAGFQWIVNTQSNRKEFSDGLEEMWTIRSEANPNVSRTAG